MNKLKILLVGTGAVGSFYGGKLSQVGIEVSTLCRSDFDIVKNKGISVKSIIGDFHFQPHQVINDINQYQSIPDYIIVATKVLPHINIPEIIKKAVHPETSIILLQNGIEIEEPIKKAFPDNEIISGLAFICVSRIGFGIVEHQDYGRLVIGKYPSGNSEKVEILSKLFNQSGVSCSIDTDVISARWKKLVWNAPFNPISVLGAGATTKEILDSQPTYILCQKVMEEVLKLAEKAGHPLPDEIIKKNLDDTKAMKPYKTSMLLDFENGREMEVEAILGNTVRLSKKLNISIPHIESLYGLLTLANKIKK